MIRIMNKPLVRISGKDSRDFLQNLITRDIGDLNGTGLLYTFLLNAKGRISFDLFVYKETDNDALLIETESKWINALESTLKLYRLRRPIEIERSEFQVYFSDVRPENESSAFPDPRVPNFGYRFLRKPEYSVKFNQNNGPSIDYLARRLIWGIPEGEELHQQLPLNMNGDIMNAISFTKGCYIGQELIARTHHMGVVRRRVLPFKSSSKNIVLGNLLDENNKRQGKILRVHKEYGLALVSPILVGTRLFDEKGEILEIIRPHWWPTNI